jgi:Double zinc ribbon
MRCPSCGFENPAGMKFCGQCATALTGPCPQCGIANPPGFAFSGQCATLLTNIPSAPHPLASSPAVASPHAYTPSYLAEKILTSRSAHESERMQVTVLFIDVSDVTIRSERLGTHGEPDTERQAWAAWPDR